MILSFDVADTLIALKRPVADVYREAGEKFGLMVSNASLHSAFATVFSSTPDPEYDDLRSGHDIETDWWEEVVYRTFEHSSGQARESSWRGIFDQLFAHYEAAEAWELYPDTLPALEEAREVADKLIVVSNFDLRLHPILENLGLTPYFDLVVSSADARSRKPDSGIFRYTEEKLRARGSTIHHVGDSHSRDFIGARNAGWIGFHLLRPENNLLDFVRSRSAGL